MQYRHSDRQQYFNEQVESTKKFVLPYIKEAIPAFKANSRVLEIGCGEGGNLVPFLEYGCECYGVELSEGNYKNAIEFHSKLPYREHLHLFNNDIYNITYHNLGGKFDVIFLRDVIEHIPNQEKFMQHLKQFLQPDGVVFFAFPPWRMPFGGHQQICKNKFLSKLPYFHILPNIIYEKILKMFGESCKSLLEIKETGISINRFQRIIRKENFEIIKKEYWFINPNYEVKFGLRPRKLLKILQIPFLQDFYVTAAYYLLKIK